MGRKKYKYKLKQSFKVRCSIDSNVCIIDQIMFYKYEEYRITQRAGECYIGDDLIYGEFYTLRDNKNKEYIVDEETLDTRFTLLDT